jgi:mono/diheme cytochrome c family protein
MKREFLAVGVVLFVLVVFPAGLFGYQAWRTSSVGVRVIDIVARAPAQGGFSPDHLQLKVGERVRLRLSSPDVVHGFNIPGLGVDIKEILPGKVVEIDVTPSAPGRYAFACTRWCSVDHWRMRGVIEVEGADPLNAATAQAPLYQQLGLNLDAIRHDATPGWSGQASAGRGAALGVSLPADLAQADRRRAITPADAFAALRAGSNNRGLSDGDIWDLVAWAWLQDARPETLAHAQALYRRDCAACHGPGGNGDGPAGRSLPGLNKMDATMKAGPADFRDSALLLNASDAVLQGKILRGGMGTGMPEFGSLYTDQELWAMVAYLRTFLFGGK